MAQPDLVTVVRATESGKKLAAVKLATFKRQHGLNAFARPRVPELWITCQTRLCCYPRHAMRAAAPSTCRLDQRDTRTLLHTFEYNFCPVRRNVEISDHEA